MSPKWLNHVKEALGNLNPEEVRAHADRRVRLLLYADSDEAYRTMEEFFAPPQHVSKAKRAELAHLIHRASEGLIPGAQDVEIYFEESDSRRPRKTDRVFAFNPHDPEATIAEILQQRRDLAIPLARHIYAFRQEVTRRIVKKICKENALFSLATAIPDVIPLLSLPWAVGEFASDTVILTANQIRMAFFLAAASDRPIGYREQKGEIASIVAGAVGWRALARELVGKIPLGGGLIPKAAIAYAGTRVVGMSLERYYRIGYGYTRQERRAAYEDALERGKTLAASLLQGLKHRKQVEA